MNKENAIEAARAEAMKNRVNMVVVNDPIANAEEAEPYGYAPRAAVDVLFRHRVKADDYFIEWYGHGENPFFEYSAADMASWMRDAAGKGGK
jgi:hypothetical protein